MRLELGFDRGVGDRHVRREVGRRRVAEPPGHVLPEVLAGHGQPVVGECLIEHADAISDRRPDLLPQRFRECLAAFGQQPAQKADHACGLVGLVVVVAALDAAVGPPRGERAIHRPHAV